MASITIIDSKTAYEKGWISPAKDIAAAADKFGQKFGIEMVAAWMAGRTDKAEGREKFATFTAVELQSEATGTGPDLWSTVDDVEETEAPKLEVVPEPIEDAEIEEAAEAAAAPVLSVVPELSAMEQHPSNGIPVVDGVRVRETPTVAELRAAADTMDKADAREARATAAAMKRHYGLGYRYADKHAGDLEKAVAAYYKRHGGRKIRMDDFMDGFEDFVAGRPFGAVYA